MGHFACSSGYWLRGSERITPTTKKRGAPGCESSGRRPTWILTQRSLWPARTTWSAAIVISLLFFLSVMFHEMAHALVARAYGLRVRTITLFALGGVTQIEKQAAKPAAEFWMGLAGPLMSAAVGMLSGWLAAWWGRGSSMANLHPPAAIWYHPTPTPHSRRSDLSLR